MREIVFETTNKELLSLIDVIGDWNVCDGSPFIDDPNDIRIRAHIWSEERREITFIVWKEDNSALWGGECTDAVYDGCPIEGDLATFKGTFEELLEAVKLWKTFKRSSWGFLEIP